MTIQSYMEYDQLKLEAHSVSGIKTPSAAGNATWTGTHYSISASNSTSLAETSSSSTSINSEVESSTISLSYTQQLQVNNLIILTVMILEAVFFSVKFALNNIDSGIKGNATGD